MAVAIGAVRMFATDLEGLENCTPVRTVTAQPMTECRSDLVLERIVPR